MVACHLDQREQGTFLYMYGGTPYGNVGTNSQVVGAWLQDLCQGGNIIVWIVHMVAGFCLVLQPWHIQNIECSRFVAGRATKPCLQGKVFARGATMRHQTLFRRQDVRARQHKAPPSRGQREKCSRTRKF